MNESVPRHRGFPGSGVVLCDSVLVSGLRVGDEVPGAAQVVGRWPAELETDSFVRLAETVGEAPQWCDFSNAPAVAQKLDERAKPQPLEQHTAAHLHHLQHACHRPRMHLRVEEERVPVSRARRTPVRAVADLVSHPADWEHRTLRSIQPARVLARLIEDEWNLYENRVAVRLVDHLLAYLAKRLEELHRIEATLQTTRDHGDEARTSFWRARRVMSLWAESLDSKTEETLRQTIQMVERLQRDLQILLDSPLYRRVPRRATVPVSLRPTNILINDPHYRKVAALWRAWAKYGHKRQETQRERLRRRQREAAAWDQFVYHLVVRAFAGLGWTAQSEDGGATLTKSGWHEVALRQGGTGGVRCSSGKSDLLLLPVCASVDPDESGLLTALLSNLDKQPAEIVVVHVGEPLTMDEIDRGAGWSFGGRTVLLGCSPWSIDSEERTARLVAGWVSRACALPYPPSARIGQLLEQPRWEWLRWGVDEVSILRAPTPDEDKEFGIWSSRMKRTVKAMPKKQKRRREVQLAALADLGALLKASTKYFEHLASCPVCGATGSAQPQQGGQAATWVAACFECGSEWGGRRCGACGEDYLALSPSIGVDSSALAAEVAPQLWPDKVFGRDVWAQPCAGGSKTQFRCPACGACGGGRCGRCR